EVRRQRWNFAATAAATFVMTTSAIGLALWRTQALRGPEPAHASGPAPAREAKQVSGEAKGPTAEATPVASPEGGGRGSSWANYRNPHFSFTLKYPADVFAYDMGPSNENVRIFVSRDGGAMLHIFAADNIAETTLIRYRHARMETRYAGAVFDQAPQRKFGF